MDDVLDAAVGLSSLASSGITTAPYRKPRTPYKTATGPKKKKELTPEERARQSKKRKGRMTKKDSRKVKRRQDKEEQMNTFMKIQRRRLEMEAKKQTRVLEMEAENQAKMLEIEAANAKTKTKEVALSSMMTGMEIMKVDLNTVSPKKRSWFEKMHADMLKFTNE
ncbi:Protein UXT-like protein [Hordeum vulgare]|nr:Protein UXT-like protein [Hordeum vulgare]